MTYRMTDLEPDGAPRTGRAPDGPVTGAGHLDGGHIATDPELILVRRDEWDAVRGDKCLLEDEVARLHLALGEIASTSAWPANEMAREALGE